MMTLKFLRLMENKAKLFITSIETAKKKLYMAIEHKVTLMRQFELFS
jgi:hypothetical protein